MTSIMPEKGSSVMTPTRLPACDPCREAKVACDHGQPICSRCSERGLSSQCEYRARPFKRRKKDVQSSLPERNDREENSIVYATPQLSNSPGRPSSVQQHRPSLLTGQSPASASVMLDGLPANSHPNPGYQGSSSYVTIFDQMVSNGITSNQSTVSQPHTGSEAVRSPSSRVNNNVIHEGIRVLQDIKDLAMFPACTKLFEDFFAKGKNVALCSRFSEDSVHASIDLIEQLNHFPLADVSRSLCLTSSSPLAIHSDIEAFIASFCGKSPRWETLALCFLLLPRATWYIESLNGCFRNLDERRDFRKQVIRLSDQCLEIALSLDCLNDLQLFVQYENFIAHSHVDGDQSYVSWRKLGDVASSMFALGYQDDVSANSPLTPEWLQSLRKVAVARSYSADKNIAIFLGRPPRISRRYINSKVIGQIAHDLEDNASKELWFREEINHPTFCFDLDTWWSAMCARLKEEALDLSRDCWHRDAQTRRASIIVEHAKAQWEALPPQFYLTGPIKNHSCDAIERDFLVGARLNHLHVLFLTSIAQAEFIPEPCHNLISVSAKMLSIVTEAMMLRNYLISSGTRLMWKLIYYGLPAAGVVCLYLLDRSSATRFHDISRTKALQDLNVLVAQIESQAFTDNEDPNYDLLSNAAKTMQAIIEKFLSGDFSRADESRPNVQPQVVNNIEDQLFPWHNNLPLQDFENDFWLNLADHPALGG